jgi:hypothetical protein
MLKQPRRRITRATLNKYASLLGRDSPAGQAIKQADLLARDGIRSEFFMRTTGFDVQTVCRCYRFG